MEQLSRLISNSFSFATSRPATPFDGPSWGPMGLSVSLMDNLASHKSDAVRETIEKAGAELLFLPPCSPDLNPIEQVFAKLKHLLRKAAKRTIETLWEEIGKLLDRFPPEECANYIRNSGYCIA